MKIAYVGMNAAGAETQGVVEAANNTEAVAAVRSMGLFPVSIREVGADVPLSDPAPVDGGAAANGAECGAEAPQDEINVAIDKVAESCAVLRDGLTSRGFSGSDAIELVKVFLANSMYSGALRQG